MSGEMPREIDPSSRRAAPSTRLLRWGLPFVVTGVCFAFIFATLDVGAALAAFTPRVALVFGPALAVFLGVSLLIEAICLVRVIDNAHLHPEGEHHRLRDLLLTARIKAASYLLSIVNYALGAGAVTWLLRRRAEMPLADAAGAVLLIALLDVGSLLLMVILGVGFMGAQTPGLRAGVVLGAAALIVLGFVVLRAPVAMGPLDRLRALQIFEAARTRPISLLIELGVLRLLFVGCFIALAHFLLSAFGVRVPAANLFAHTSVLLVISALPIAVAGLGTGNLAFVELFGRWGDRDVLMAASLTLSAALIVTRTAIGLVFAREFTAEAFKAREEIT